MPDKPWRMRTCSGRSAARASNPLYRSNLAKGQTGLSIAFDLPTQTGYDPDSPEAAGEVGKVGVPVAHLGHMDQLLDAIPVAEMNTSMTINATAAWLLGLYVAHAQRSGVDEAVLAGTTQNDIVKEYLSRGTYIFPPEHSRRLTVDTVAYTAAHIPKWNPINVCSYHLQEAGATPVQEIAYALATAIGVLDAVRDSGQVADDRFTAVFASISFFVNAGIRFVEETCKMRAFTEMWDRIGLERYGVTDDKARRFRYGVQVNSLGLTEAQPENNVQRIVLEALGVTLSKEARARSIQLPAWNEALGLPRPWDQQWSLRLQQVLAYETDLLEYDDLFEGSVVVERKVAELMEQVQEEVDRVQALGGAVAAVESGYMKSELVASHAERRRRIEAGAALAAVREQVKKTGEELGVRLRLLVGKPGLDGHSNGAEQIAVRARDAGFEVVYQGIRLTPAQIVSAAVEEDVHVIGLSILSGSHMEAVPAVLDGLREAGAGDVPVVVGGIIPDADAARLLELGVAKVFTPKDYELTDIMREIVGVVRAAHALSPV